MAIVIPIAPHEAVFCDSCDKYVKKTDVEPTTQYYLEGYYTVDTDIESEGSPRDATQCRVCGDVDGAGNDRFVENTAQLFVCTYCGGTYDDLDEARRCCA